MDTIDCMRAFVEVANNRSFTRAGEKLGVNTKQISKQVRSLEDRLGAQLFNRTTRNVTLTEAGRAYLTHCAPLLKRFDDMERSVQDRQGELSGPIRISAPTGFGAQELVPALYSFKKAHPKISIDLRLSDENVAVAEERFDLALRFEPSSDSALIARKLLEMRRVVVAAPSYLEDRGTPAHPQELQNHSCLIQLASPDPYVWTFQVDGDKTSVNVSGSFSVNSPRALANMAALGLGIGRCPHYTARPFLDNGSLRVLFENYEVDISDLFAVYPPNRYLSARVRSLIDFLCDFFKTQGFGARTNAAEGMKRPGSAARAL